MLLEQLLFGLGNVLIQVPPLYYLGIFILVIAGVIVVSGIFHYHIQQYTFRDYKTGMIRLVYIGGLGILLVIALILLALIFGLS